MSLNIKNEATHAKVRKLAEAWKTSQVEAVDRAVSLQLSGIEYDGRMSQLEQVLRDVRTYRADGIDAASSADFLYDHDGLAS